MRWSAQLDEEVGREPDSACLAAVASHPTGSVGPLYGLALPAGSPRPCATCERSTPNMGSFQVAARALELSLSWVSNDTTV